MRNFTDASKLGAERLLHAASIYMHIVIHSRLTKVRNRFIERAKIIIDAVHTISTQKNSVRARLLSFEKYLKAMRDVNIAQASPKSSKLGRRKSMLKNDAPRSVGDIAETIGATQSAVSHQLRILREGHIIRARRDGQNIVYSLADAHVVAVLALACEHLNCAF